MTALAFVLTMGPVGRFERSKQGVSCGASNGWVPAGNRERRAAQAASKFDPELRRDHERLRLGRSNAGSYLLRLWHSS